MFRWKSCLPLALCLAGPLCAQQISREVLPEGAKRVMSQLPGYENRPVIHAYRLADGETITVDGRLNEPVWKSVEPATDFVQQDPQNGRVATEKTEVRIAYNSEKLYMGVICYDSEPDKLKRNQMLRDGFLQADDRFMWVFDPFLSGISGYFFETNPSGLMADALVIGAGGSGGGTTNVRGWDGIFMLKVHRSEIGWSFEVEIPFRTLAFDPKVPAWGINFQRTVRRKQEESFWNGWGRNMTLQRMANAGLLEGISNITQGIGLNAQPYVIGRFLESPATGVPPTFKGSLGGDLIYTITPQLKGNFTINTDFAETEVDQRQVNLTQFPLFFPERRTFFLEGSNFLAFSREPDNIVTPYFSRSIGLNPDGTTQRIDYGAKVTGQVGLYDLGFLHVQTANSALKAGENITVMRGRRRFFRQSYAGLLFTRRNDRSGVGDDRYTAGADFSLATSRFRGNQNLELSGFYLKNTNLEHTAGSGAYGVRLDYPNDRYSGRVAYREIQGNYNPSVGFLQRRDIRNYNNLIQFAPRPRNNRLVRRYVYYVNTDVYTDLNNVMRTRTIDFDAFHVEFQSGDIIQFHVVPTFERPATDFKPSAGIVLSKDVGYNFTRGYVQFQSANRRMFAVTALYYTGGFYSGTRTQAALTVNTRPRPGILLTTDWEWNGVDLKEGHFSTSLYRLTANTQVNPFISFANIVQYDNVSRVVGWQSRFRWIVRPGNDIYVVYSHNWLSDPVMGLTTLSRNAASKVVYTHQF